MFIAGANQNSPEIRSSSIKGLIRYWWRATQAESNLENLRNLEGALFGTVIKPAHKSPVAIRMHSKNPMIANHKPVPHKGYLVKAINVGFEFSIDLIFRNEIASYADILDLAMILGGLGRRSRRGFGATKRIDQGSEHTISMDYVYSLLTKITHAQYKKNNSRIILHQNVRLHYPYIRKIEIGKDWDSWKELLEYISKETKRNKTLIEANRKNTRFASPIWISVLEDENENSFRPIVTTLHIAGSGKRTIKSEMENFGRVILNA
jgi:CRISPR-associated protein Cmr1